MQVFVPEVRLSFANVIKGTRNPGSGEIQYVNIFTASGKELADLDVPVSRAQNYYNQYKSVTKYAPNLLPRSADRDALLDLADTVLVAERLNLPLNLAFTKIGADLMVNVDFVEDREAKIFVNPQELYDQMVLEVFDAK